MATNLGRITLNGVLVISCDTNPSISTGLVAPIGSIAFALDGSGFYIKSTIANTGWFLSEITNNKQNSLVADGTGTKYVTVDATISALASKISGMRGIFTANSTSQTSFTVTFGGTQPNNTYYVGITALNPITAAQNYLVTKTLTTFTVTYLTGLIGNVSFDWVLLQ